MGDLAVSRKRERAEAGIAEQVEALGLAHSIELQAHPVPHRSHVGEELQVAEWCRAGGEVHLVPVELPAFIRQVLRELPAPAAILVRAGDELACCGPVREARLPHRLRFGADEGMGAERLPLAPRPAVEQAVGVPAGAFHHQRLLDEAGHQPFASAAWPST